MSEVAELKAPQVQEVFGKFATKVDGKIVMFDTAEQANEAATLVANAEAYNARVDAYLKARNIDGKTGVARRNVIIDFLSYEG